MTILLTSDSFFRPQKCMHATPSPDQTLVYSALFCFSFESLLHAWLARPLNHNTNLCKLMQKKNTQAKNVYFSLVARHINSQQTSTSEACTASRSVIYHGCSVYACIDQCCIHRVPLVRSVAPNNSSFPMYTTIRDAARQQGTLAWYELSWSLLTPRQLSPCILPPGLLNYSILLRTCPMWHTVHRVSSNLLAAAIYLYTYVAIVVACLSSLV